MIAKNKRSLILVSSIAALLTLLVAVTTQPLSKNYSATKDPSDPALDQLSTLTTELQNQIAHFDAAPIETKNDILNKATQRKNQINQQLAEAKQNQTKIDQINKLLKIGSTYENLSQNAKNELAEVVEKPVNVTGKISPIYIEYEGASTEEGYILSTLDNKITYRVYSAQPLPSESTIVTINGKAIDNTLVIGSATALSSLMTVTNSDASTTFKNTGTLNTLVVIIPLPGIPLKDLFGDDITADKIYNQFMVTPVSVKNYFESASYYPQNSNGSTIALSKSDIVSIPYYKTPTSCDLTGWSNYADSKLSSTQLAKDRIMYVMPRTSLCVNAASQAPMNGWGQIKGSRTWIIGNLTTRVLAHEMTHNAGAHHSMAMYCGDNRQFTSLSDSQCKWGKNQDIVNGEPVEYADMYDVMGSGGKYADATKTLARNWAPNPAAVWKKNIGWLSSSRSISLGTTVQQKTITLLPLDTYASSGYQQIKISAPQFSSSENYYVEFRRPSGLDNVWPTNQLTYGGILIRLYGDTTKQVAYGSSTAIPALLDPIAPFNADYSDRALKNPGDKTTDTYIDAKNKIIIRFMPGSTLSAAKVCVGVGNTTTYCQ